MPRGRSRPRGRTGVKIGHTRQHREAAGGSTSGTGTGTTPPAPPSGPGTVVLLHDSLVKHHDTVVIYGGR